MLSLNFNSFPVLHTNRLLLRIITKNDADDLFVLRSNKKIMQFIDRPMATSIKDSLEYIEKMETSLKDKNGITWGITLQNNTALIGTIGFWRIVSEHYRAEIGYMLHSNFHGKGIMQEAIETILDYGFRKIKLHSVEANVNPANVASVKLLEKNGFIKEAHFKENYYYNGKFLDSVIYSLLAKNFKLESNPKPQQLAKNTHN